MRFTALVGMTRAMMNTANIPRAIRYKFFGKAAKTTTKLDSLVIVDVYGVKKMQVKHYADTISLWVKFMRTFGKAGPVRTDKDGKFVDRGVTMTFLG